MIINGENLIVGRLASFAAKKARMGEKIIIVNSEKAVFSGSKKDVFERFKRKRKMGNVFKGPFVSRTSDKIVRRAIRGMVDYKKSRGMEAYRRIKCYVGVPEEYKNEKMESLDNANVGKLPNLKFVKVDDISKFLGKND